MLIRTTVISALLALSTNCLFDNAPRDNPNDPEADNYEAPATAVTGIQVADLFAWWNMNGNVNDKWDDGTGLQNMTGPQGAGHTSGYISDRFGNATSAIEIMAGAPNELNVGNFAALGSEPLTLIFWQNFSTTPSPSLETLMSKVGAVACASGINGYRIGTSAISNFELRVQQATSCASVTLNSFTISPSIWYMVAIVIESGTSHIYGGQHNLTLFGPHSVTSSFIPNTTNDLVFTISTGNLRIDDVLLYTRALSKSEITDIFNSTEQ